MQDAIPIRLAGRNVKITNNAAFHRERVLCTAIDREFIANLVLKVLLQYMDRVPERWLEQRCFIKLSKDAHWNDLDF